MAATLLLDRDTWDVCLTAGGNIAVATEPYSLVQSVSSACRLFLGDCYYDTTLGIPYFEQVLGEYQPVQVVKGFLVQAALTVPGVTSATAVLSGLSDRVLRGQVQFVANGAPQIAPV